MGAAHDQSPPQGELTLGTARPLAKVSELRDARAGLLDLGGNPQHLALSPAQSQEHQHLVNKRPQVYKPASRKPRALSGRVQEPLMAVVYPSPCPVPGTLQTPPPPGGRSYYHLMQRGTNHLNHPACKWHNLDLKAADLKAGGRGGGCATCTSGVPERLCGHPAEAVCALCQALVLHLEENVSDKCHPFRRR